MRILADENIQQRTVQYLREKGWDIVWAADEDLSGEPDERVFEHAQKHERVLLTYNAHFADMRRLASCRHHGIIRLRFSDQRVLFVHSHLSMALTRLGEQDLHDALVTVTDDRIRVRNTDPGQSRRS